MLRCDSVYESLVIEVSADAASREFPTAVRITLMGRY